MSFDLRIQYNEIISLYIDIIPDWKRYFKKIICKINGYYDNNLQAFHSSVGKVMEEMAILVIGYKRLVIKMGYNYVVKLKLKVRYHFL